MTTIGLTKGVHYDWVDGAGFASVNFYNYEAICTASSFGGMFTQTELNAMIARKTDIKNYINAGGGLMGLSECYPSSDSCDGSNIITANTVFGFVPITGS